MLTPRVPKPVFASRQCIVVPRSHWVQAEGKIEVDGSDQRDGDKDGKLSQFLKQHRALNPSLARSRSRLLFLGLLSKNKILQILSLRLRGGRTRILGLC